MKTTTWVEKNGGLVEIAWQHELRIRRLEGRDYKRRSGMPEFCDAPRCKESPKFQCGQSSKAKIGSWCSDAHFEKYAL